MPEYKNISNLVAVDEHGQCRRMVEERAKAGTRALATGSGGVGPQWGKLEETVRRLLE